MPELQAEARLLAGEAEVLGGRPHLGDLRGRGAGAHLVDRVVEPFAALLVGGQLRARRAADAERAVVARAVAHERVDDVEERLVAGAQQAVGEHVRVRVAAIAGDGVDRLDLLGAELEQQPLGVGDDLVLTNARAQRLVDLLVDRVDDRGRMVEQRDLVLGLELARLHQHRLGVGGRDVATLQREQRLHVGQVDTQRLGLKPVLPQDLVDMAGQQVGNAGLLGHRAAHRRHAGAPARLRQPRRVELVVLGRRAEVPQNRVADPRQQRAARALVARPLPDVGARDVADVVLVKQQNRAEVRRLERVAHPLQAVGAQPHEIDPLFPVDSHRRAARPDHRCPLIACLDTAHTPGPLTVARSSRSSEQSARVGVGGDYQSARASDP